MTRRLEPEDLYAITLVDDPQITPDGQRVAYVVVEIDRKTYDYHRTIWVSDTAQSLPRRYTAGDNDTAPRWSPDGRSLVFVRAPAGEVKPKNEEERDRGVGKGQLWLLPADGGEARQLTWARWGAGDPAWSPDGRQLAFVAARRRHDDGYTDLMVADAATAGAVRKLTDDFLPTFSDTAIDDQRVGHGGPHLYWSADGKEIFSQAAGRGSTLVYAVPATGGTPRLVIGGQRRIYALSMDRERRRVALASSDPSTPGDLFLQDSAGGHEARVTELNASLFREVALATPQEFTFKGADGWEIHGWIIRPSPHPGPPPQAVEGKSERPPAVLEIHGGPMAMYSWSFFFEFQLLASHGYAVVLTNPRGSTGYGRPFSAAVNGDWGGKDFQDIMAGIDAAISNGWVDPQRLGVAGGSYGGYMTNWTVGHTDRFKAAVTMRCVSNMASIFGTGDLDWILTIDSMDAVPWKDLDRLMERSPITYVARITTPLLILHADRDLRCPISEGEQMFTALKLLGREVRMVRFEGQSHELSRSGHPRSRVIRRRHIVGWSISHTRTEALKPSGELARAGAAGE